MVSREVTCTIIDLREGNDLIATSRCGRDRNPARNFALIRDQLIDPSIPGGSFDSTFTKCALTQHRFVIDRHYDKREDWQHRHCLERGARLFLQPDPKGDEEEEKDDSRITLSDRAKR